VLQSIEALPPGLYGMNIAERKGDGGEPGYEVSFVELRLEEVASRLNRFEREDERPFEAMNAVAELNQRAYELFARPWVQALSSEPGAALQRAFHPLRLQRWAISDLNPLLWWLAPAAQAVKAQRQALASDHPSRQVEQTVSELTSATLDGFRALRDSVAEAAFFQTYGHLHAFFGGDKLGATTAEAPTDARRLPLVRQALASIEQGGYAEALARVAVLMARDDQPLPLSRLQLARDLQDDYRALLPAWTPDEMRRVCGEQEVIVRYEADKAIESLPLLLTDRKDRERLLELLDRVLRDARVQRSIRPTPAQTAMLARLRGVLRPAGRRVATSPNKAARRRGAAAVAV
jgi:hypothetical protein